MKWIVVCTVCLFLTVPVMAKDKDKNKKQKSLPPGLEKKVNRGGELPPGWEKKLVKGDILDSDLYKSAKRVTNPPKGYPATPDKGTEILQIEDRIIRIKKDTKEILDIVGITL